MNREIQRERYRNMGKDRKREVVSVVVVVVGGWGDMDYFKEQFSISDVSIPYSYL